MTAENNGAGGRSKGPIDIGALYSPTFKDMMNDVVEAGSRNSPRCRKRH